MRRSATVCVLLLGLVAMGCKGDTQATTTSARSPHASSATPVTKTVIDLSVPWQQRSRALAGVDYVKFADEPMLPAYKTSFAPLKGDASDDIRALNPERFAITAPPKLGVRPMVEWEPMRAIMLSVPSYMAQYANAWATLASIGYHAASVAEVWYIVSAQSVVTNLTNTILNMGLDEAVFNERVKFLVQPLDSVWVIDSGPLPIVDPSTETFAFVDFRYYHERPFDDGNPSWLGRQVDVLGLEAAINTYRPPLSVEGGTFQATEDGLCITGNRQIYHMSCGTPTGCDPSIRTMPLDEIQDHPLTLEIEAVWKEYAGCVDTVVTNSITDDGTGHIDMYLKVLDTDRVLIGYYEPPYEGQAESNAARMDANAEYLASYVKPDGGSFTVERIIMPGHRTSQDANGTSYMPFTYVNSTFINGLNLWPAFTFAEWEESRDLAQSEWEAVLPEVEHIWIDSEELSFWSGAIHCVTRTVPAVTPSTWIADGACGECGACEAPEGGYDGVCRPGAADQDVCYGPEWLCGCNDCTAPCPGDISGHVPASDPCEGVPEGGCCDQASNLQYCDGGALKSINCQGQGCGWNAEKGWYDCTHEGPDPSGEQMWSCEAIKTAYAACEPTCVDKECGDDGCGGSCGVCNECDMCFGNACVPACEDACVEGEKGCNDTTQWVCARAADGCTQLFETDCALSDKACAGGLCIEPTTGGGGGGEPVVCAPDCDGRACGDDGCGGQCGACADGQLCDLAGACIDAAACTDTCEASGAVCSTVCGQSCGTCGVGYVCADFRCVASGVSGGGGEAPAAGTSGGGYCQGFETTFLNQQACEGAGHTWIVLVAPTSGGGSGCAGGPHAPVAGWLALWGLLIAAWRRRDRALV